MRELSLDDLSGCLLDHICSKVFLMIFVYVFFKQSRRAETFVTLFTLPMLEFNLSNLNVKFLALSMSARVFAFEG